MGKPVNESGLVVRIVKAIKAAHPEAYIFKVHGGPMQMAGVPDLLVSIDGMFIGMEVKFQRPRESESYARSRATPIQRVHIEKINRSGGIAAVVISPEEALDVIRRAFEKQESVRAVRLARTTEGDQQ